MLTKLTRDLWLSQNAGVSPLPLEMYVKWWTSSSSPTLQEIIMGGPIILSRFLSEIAVGWCVCVCGKESGGA